MQWESIKENLRLSVVMAVVGGASGRTSASWSPCYRGGLNSIVGTEPGVFFVWLNRVWEQLTCIGLELQERPMLWRN